MLVIVAMTMTDGAALIHPTELAHRQAIGQLRGRMDKRSTIRQWYLRNAWRSMTNPLTFPLNLNLM